jgi:glycosyltransferase involved in cell wall biosynthesis
VMTAILLRASHRVWISIPAWEPMLKPYALGRRVPFTWLPVPSALCAPATADIEAVRARLAGDGRSIVGHFGTFGSLIVSQLDQLLPLVLQKDSASCVLLIGAASRRYLKAFTNRYPEFATRVTASGPLEASAVAAHVAACDVLVQPYPDGVSSRRTTTMAGLFLGVPVVTTRGHLTEDFWEETGIVRLSRVGDWPRCAALVAELLDSSAERRRLSEQARRFYDRTFDVRHTVAALTAAQ